MKTLIKASAALISTVLFGCNFEQPQPPCAVGHGGYAAKYTHVSGATSGTCFRQGDIIGVQKYRQVDSDEQHIYLRPESLGFVPWAEGLTGDLSLETMAFGALESPNPNAQGFCTVPTLSVASGEMNSGDAVLSYTFSNVQFYVQDAVAGTQFKADLTITDAATSCTATYTVDAMYPVVFCNDTEDVDAPGYGLPLPDAESCKDAENYTDHIWSHYAASPLFDATCAPIGNLDHDYDYLADIGVTDAPFPVEWHVCLPSGPVPSLL